MLLLSHSLILVLVVTWLFICRSAEEGGGLGLILDILDVKRGVLIGMKIDGLYEWARPLSDSRLQP